MGLFDQVKALFGGTAEKATDAATKAASSASAAAGKAKTSTAGLTETAKGAAGTAAVAAVTVAGQAKEAVTGAADQHGDKVTGAVSAAHAYVSDKSGGKLDPVTGKVEEFTGKAVGALKSDSPARPTGTWVRDDDPETARDSAEMVAEGAHDLPDEDDAPES